MKGFIDFMRAQGVVGLAIGVVLGGAVGKVVTAIVTDIVTPLIGIILGAANNISDASFTILGAKFLYGDLINNLINFAAIAAVVYYGVKILGLEKIDLKK